mgnify:CR=1 FL=1
MNVHCYRLSAGTLLLAAAGLTGCDCDGKIDSVDVLDCGDCVPLATEDCGDTEVGEGVFGTRTCDASGRP